MNTGYTPTTRHEKHKDRVRAGYAELLTDIKVMKDIYNLMSPCPRREIMLTDIQELEQSAALVQTYIDTGKLPVVDVCFMVENDGIAIDLLDDKDDECIDNGVNTCLCRACRQPAPVEVDADIQF